MNDPLWNSYPYDAANTSKTETVGKTGCGPTTMATIATNLLGKAILPPVLCDWSNKNGHRDPNGADGTRPSFFTECAKKYGLRTAIINISSDNPLTSDHFTLIDQVLRANSLVAASVNSNSPYTNGGHYIMIYKIENGKVYIKDPVKSNNDLAPRACLLYTSDRCESLQGSSSRRRSKGRQSGYEPYKRGLNTKIHLAVDSSGMPVRAIITAVSYTHL